MLLGVVLERALAVVLGFFFSFFGGKFPRTLAPCVSGRCEGKATTKKGQSDKSGDTEQKPEIFPLKGNVLLPIS